MPPHMYTYTLTYNKYITGNSLLNLVFGPHFHSLIAFKESCAHSDDEDVE